MPITQIIVIDEVVAKVLFSWCLNTTIHVAFSDLTKLKSKN